MAQSPSAAGTHTAVDYSAVTPSDDSAANYTRIPRAIYVGVSGDVVLVSPEGNTATFKDLAIGLHPYQFLRVNATGTTATNMVAVF